MTDYMNGNTMSLAPPGSRRLRVAVLGCGRMGQRHVYNIMHLTPRAELVLVADPAPAAQKWAAETLPESVAYYGDPDAVFALPSHAIDAVVIATVTSTHAPLTLKAVEKGWHVLLEKPISIDVAESKPVVEAAAARPDVKVMLGFVRRFDKALGELKGRLASGGAGRVYALKSTTQDAYDPSGFFVAYARASGGIFMDCGIHDIDMSRWLLDTGKGGAGEVKRVLASGLITAHPELAEQGDCDNAFGIIEYTNGATCTLHLSRTGMAGYDSTVEAFGMDGKLTVSPPAPSAVSIADASGRHVDGTPTYIERFGDAFVREMNAFVECCLDNKPVPTTPHDALQAAQIASGLTMAFRSGKPVEFDAKGEPIVPVA